MGENLVVGVEKDDIHVGGGGDLGNPDVAGNVEAPELGLS